MLVSIHLLRKACCCEGDCSPGCTACATSYTIDGAISFQFDTTTSSPSGPTVRRYSTTITIAGMVMVDQVDACAWRYRGELDEPEDDLYTLTISEDVEILSQPPGAGFVDYTLTGSRTSTWMTNGSPDVQSQTDVGVKCCTFGGSLDGGYADWGGTFTCNPLNFIVGEVRNDLFPGDPTLVQYSSLYTLTGDSSDTGLGPVCPVGDLNIATMGTLDTIVPLSIIMGANTLAVS